MTSLRTTLGIISIALVLSLPEHSAIARPGGGFSGSHGGGFSGGHSQGSHWGGRGGYRGGYGRGYYGGFYGGVYLDPWEFGTPWGYDFAYPPAYATYPYDSPPSVEGAYVQQEPAAPVGGQRLNQPNDWYYCSNPAGYYPYVRSCTISWQRVPSIPPN